MKKGIIIGGAAALLLAVAAVFLVVLPMLKPDEEIKEAKKQVFSYKIDEIQTNLADEGKYMKAKIVFKYTLTDEEVEIAKKEHPPAAAGGHGAAPAATGPLDPVFEEVLPEIKDGIFALIREKTYADMCRPNGQKILGEEIKYIIAGSANISVDKIEGVYFEDIIFQ